VLTCFDDTRIVISKAFNHLQPGGWIELQDPDMQIESFDGTHEGTAIQRAVSALFKGTIAIGRDLYRPRSYAQWLSEAGFVDITWETIPWPVGSWPVDPKFKEIGRCTVLDVEVGLDSMKKLIQVSGLSVEETEELIVQAKRDLRNSKIHQFTKL
jgi:hypothetical protein